MAINIDELIIKIEDLEIFNSAETEILIDALILYKEMNA